MLHAPPTEDVKSTRHQVEPWVMCANVLNGGHITSKQPDAKVRIIDERGGVMTCTKQARHGLSVIADDEDLTRALEKFGMVEHGCWIE